MRPERVPLDDVLRTDLLDSRPWRTPDHKRESDALAALAVAAPGSTQAVLQALVETAMHLCDAHSAGISLLDEGPREPVFRWHAVAGRFAANLGGTIGRDASPCGLVVQKDSVELFQYPERHYDYGGAAIEFPLVEALLVPFHLGRRPVGTLWAISHDPARTFDGEDVRLLARISAFVAFAYKLKREVAGAREALAMATRRNAALRVQAERQAEALLSLVDAIRHPITVLRELSRYLAWKPMSIVERSLIESIVTTQADELEEAVKRSSIAAFDSRVRR
jgi:GAF domain-containing protein